MSDRSRLTSLLLASTLLFGGCVALLGDGPDSGGPDNGVGGNNSNDGQGGAKGMGGNTTTVGIGGRTGGGGSTGTGGNVNVGTGGRTGGGGSTGTGGNINIGTGGRGTGGTITGLGGSVSGIGGRGVGGSGLGGSGVGGAVGSVACLKPGAEYTANNGSVTFYTLSQGSNGVVHCSYNVTGQNPDVIQHNPNGAGQYFAAINTADYNGAHTCGACVEVTRDGNRRVVAQVVDECPSGSNPKCVRGHIDLSQNAFLQLGTTQEGFLGTGNTLQPTRANVGSISWRYVACPTTGNVFARIKPGNPNEIFFENLIVPIKGVSMNGQTSNTLQTYNAWNFGGSNIPAGAAFSLTDINDSVITFNLQSATPNQDQDTGKRFPTCQ
jgi:expansin (peptidoglycan-binding protein)